MIRRAAPEDRSGVVATVKDAFANDPAWAFILGGDYEWLAAHFTAALFDLRVASSNVWVSDDLAAVAMWDAPGRNPVGGHAEIVWSRYRALAGEEAFERLASYNAAVRGASLPEPHWYLGVLATHPERQREGLATAVLAPTLAEADRLGLPCCLETSTEENRRFYEGRGFGEAREIRVPGGPLTWWLTRRR